MSKLEHDADLGEYELHVLDALYVQMLGRELTMGERFFRIKR